MNVILFGASGMVGQGVLRECLLDPDVERVLSVVRAPGTQTHAKLRELVHPDFTGYADVEAELTGFDACMFCLGVSASGMTEAEYAHVTYDYTIAAAETLARLNPTMTFLYISGAGTDSTERKRSMWARVKGRTENALLKLPFKAAYMFRPAIIKPLHGIKSKTRMYRVFYTAFGWSFPMWKLLFPRYMTTTEQLGRAMLAAARHGAPKPVLDTRDFNALVGRQVAAGSG